MATQVFRRPVISTEYILYWHPEEAILVPLEMGNFDLFVFCVYNCKWRMDQLMNPASLNWPGKTKPFFLKSKSTLKLFFVKCYGYRNLLSIEKTCSLNIKKNHPKSGYFYINTPHRPLLKFFSSKDTKTNNITTIEMFFL